jgi:dynamin GTPase
VPQIQSHIAAASRELEQQLRALGGDAPLDRGGRLHAVLSLCDAFDRAFEALLEGGRGGGERVRAVFESTLPAALRALPFGTVFSLRGVKDVIEVADGIQPHLIAPELGMRRLIRDGVALLRPPAEAVVDAVHAILRDAIEAALTAVAKEHPAISRFAALRAALCNTAEASLERYREVRAAREHSPKAHLLRRCIVMMHCDDATYTSCAHVQETRKMVTTLVDMESAYFTAEFFRNAQAQAAAQQLAAEMEEQQQGSGSAAAPASAMSIGALHLDDGPSRAHHLANGGTKSEFAPEVHKRTGVAARCASQTSFRLTARYASCFQVEAHLRRVSATVAAYVASVCDSLKKNIPKAVVHCQVLQAKKSLLTPLYQQVGGISEEQLEQLLGGAARARVCALCVPAAHALRRLRVCARVRAQRTRMRCSGASRARSGWRCCAAHARRSPPP